MRFIKINIFIILFLFSSSKILAQKPWKIKNWVYKEGSYEGQKLGSYVHSPKKNNNLLITNKKNENSRISSKRNSRKI